MKIEIIPVINGVEFEPEIVEGDELIIKITK